MDNGYNLVLKMGLVIVVMLSGLFFLPQMVSQTFGELLGDDATSTTAPTAPENKPPAANPTPTTQPAPPTQPNEPFDWSWAIGLAIGMGTVGAAGGLSYGAWRFRVHRRELATRRQRQLDLWAKGVAAFDAVSEALTQFEMDWESVCFTRPLLADVSEPATAEFHQAFTAAQSLYTETVPADDSAIAAFVDAAAKARVAFTRADDNATRKARLGVANDGRLLTETELKKLSQARGFMAQAHDPASTREAAKIAHDKALSLLEKAGVVIPKRLVAKVTQALEAELRPALVAGASR